MGDGRRLDAAGGAELGHDVGHVQAGRLRGDEQRGPDVLVAPSRRDQPEDLKLPGSQASQRIAGLVRRVAWTLPYRRKPGAPAEVIHCRLQRYGAQVSCCLRGEPPLAPGCLVAAGRGQRLR